MGLDDFRVIHTHRKKHKDAPKDSGGVLVAYRKSLQKGISVFSKNIWLKLDKNIFGLEQDLFLAGVYITPSNSPYLKRCKLNSLRDLDKSIKKTPLGGRNLNHG